VENYLCSLIRISENNGRICSEYKLFHSLNSQINGIFVGTMHGVLICTISVEFEGFNEEARANVMSGESIN
jgi:hypothetical protein